MMRYLAILLLALSECSRAPAPVASLPPGYAPAYPSYDSLDWQRANCWQWRDMR